MVAIVFIWLAWAIQLATGGVQATLADTRANFEQGAIAQALILGLVFVLIVSRELAHGTRSGTRRALMPLFRNVVLVLVLTLFGTCLGLLLNNSLNYIEGDVFRFLWPCAVMLTAYLAVMQEPDPERAGDTLLYGAFLILLAFLCFDLVQNFRIQGIHGRLWTESAQMAPWMLPLLVYLGANPRFQRQKPLFVAAGFIAVAALMISETRTLLGLGVLAFAMMMWTHPIPALRRRLTAILLIGGTVLVALAVGTTAGRDVLTGIGGRMELVLTQLNPDQQYGVAYYRWIEERQVVRHLDASPVEWLIGAGFGSSIEVEASLGENGQWTYGWGTMHYIHDAYLEVLLRSGFIGLAIVGWFLGWVTRRSLRLLQGDARWLVGSSIILFVAGLFFFDGVFQTTILYLILAVALARTELAPERAEAASLWELGLPTPGNAS